MGVSFFTANVTMKIILALCLVLPFAASQLAGGLTPMDGVDLSDANVQFALKAINNFYASKGDNAARVAVKLVSASEQVVAGAMYHFVIEVSGGVSNENCAVSVWSRPWLSGAEALQIAGDPQCQATSA